MLVVHWFAVGHGLFAQILAVLLWGVAIAAWAALPGAAVPWRRLQPLLLAFGLLAFGVAVSAVLHRAPAGIGLGTLGVVAAAAAAAGAGARAAQQQPEWATRALMWGLVFAAVASLLVAILQLAAPGWASNWWVAAARTPGRASANLDQPNHLATVLVWAWLAVAAWSARTSDAPAVGSAYAAPAGPRAAPDAPGTLAIPVVQVPSGGAFLLAFALQAGVVATASRAGLLASMVIGLWAALDRRLPRPTAWLLWITALGGLTMTIGRALTTPATMLGAGASLVRPGARGGVFMDALSLIRDAPLSGVGWMEFQLAWSLSPLGDRGPRYFDHPHNLVLNLIVELGLPLGLAICACLVWGAVVLLRSLGRVPNAAQTRALMLAAMLGVIGLHSLFDAPFWYAYLLLPSAWAWGCLVGMTGPEGSPANIAAPSQSAAAALGTGARRGLAAAGVLLAVAALLVWFDFRRVLPAAQAVSSGPTFPSTAMASARAALPSATAALVPQSHLFTYYADHQRALVAPDAAPELFRGARWVWIDTPLLAAWIASLERAGRLDEARYLMQRALEFRDPAFTSWLAACRVVAPLEPPPRCRPPARLPHWRDFR